MLSTENDLKAREGVKKLLDKYITAEQKSKWPAKYYEIHYHDLIRGHNIYSSLDHPQRKAMADELFNLIMGLKPVLFATAVSKMEMKKRYGSNAYNPRSYALRATIHRYSMYLDFHKLAGTIVVDEEEYRRDKDLREMIHDFRTKGIILRSWDYNPRFENTLERILNAVNFSPSSMSPGLQLADMITRTTWSHFERNKSNRFDQLKGLWNDPSRTAYDPSVVPKPR